MPGGIEKNLEKSVMLIFPSCEPGILNTNLGQYCHTNLFCEMCIIWWGFLQVLYMCSFLTWQKFHRYSIPVPLLLNMDLSTCCIVCVIWVINTWMFGIKGAVKVSWIKHYKKYKECQCGYLSGHGIGPLSSPFNRVLFIVKRLSCHCGKHKACKHIGTSEKFACVLHTLTHLCLLF